VTIYGVDAQCLYKSKCQRKHDNHNDMCANLMVLDNGLVNVTQKVENNAQEPKRQGVSGIQLQHFLIGRFGLLVSPAKSDDSIMMHQSPQTDNLPKFPKGCSEVDISSRPSFLRTLSDLRKLQGLLK
jgi:hypothetical protein